MFDTYSGRQKEKQRPEKIDYGSIPIESAKQFNESLREKRNASTNAEEFCEHVHTIA